MFCFMITSLRIILRIAPLSLDAADVVSSAVNSGLPPGLLVTFKSPSIFPLLSSEFMFSGVRFFSIFSEGIDEIAVMTELFISVAGSTATSMRKEPPLMKPNTIMKISGKRMLNMTAEGFLNSALRLAFVMLIIALNWL